MIPFPCDMGCRPQGALGYGNSDSCSKQHTRVPNEPPGVTPTHGLNAPNWDDVGERHTNSHPPGRPSPRPWIAYTVFPSVIVTSMTGKLRSINLHPDAAFAIPKYLRACEAERPAGEHAVWISTARRGEASAIAWLPLSSLLRVVTLGEAIARQLKLTKDEVRYVGESIRFSCFVESTSRTTTRTESRDVAALQMSRDLQKQSRSGRVRGDRPDCAWSPTSPSRPTVYGPHSVLKPSQPTDRSVVAQPARALSRRVRRGGSS